MGVRENSFIDKERQRSQLEALLLEALRTEEIAIASEELKGRSLVSLLREKLVKN